jgi:hypothetical protein
LEISQAFIAVEMSQQRNSRALELTYIKLWDEAFSFVLAVRTRGWGSCSRGTVVAAELLQKREPDESFPGTVAGWRDLGWLYIARGQF